MEDLNKKIKKEIIKQNVYVLIIIVGLILSYYFYAWANWLYNEPIRTAM